MATHARADSVGNLFRPAWRRPAARKPQSVQLQVLEVITTAVVIIAMSVVLVELREITWGVVLLFVFLPAEGFLVAWKAMRAPWDRLVDGDETRGQADT